MAENIEKVEELKDIPLVCKDCRKPFTYTIWEQKQFGLKGWAPPKRCVACRQRRRILKKALNELSGHLIRIRLMMWEITIQLITRLYVMSYLKQELLSTAMRRLLKIKRKNI